MIGDPATEYDVREAAAGLGLGRGVTVARSHGGKFESPTPSAFPPGPIPPAG